MSGSANPKDEATERRMNTVEDAGLRDRAAAFLDLWERHVSEHARTAPEAASALRKTPR